MPRESQIEAVHRMTSWVSLCQSETDLCVGMPSSRAVLVTGKVAVGKSSCIDALARSGWEAFLQPLSLSLLLRLIKSISLLLLLL